MTSSPRGLGLGDGLQRWLLYGQRLSNPPAPVPAQGRAAQSCSNSGAFNKVPMKPMTSIVDWVPLSPILGQDSPSSSSSSRHHLHRQGRKRKRFFVHRTLFGLGTAAAATPSSLVLSTSIATPLLSSTAITRTTICHHDRHDIRS